MVNNILNILKRIATDLSQMDENQVDVYYAMLESVSHFRLGIEQLEQTDVSNWMIRELNDLFRQMEEVISQAIPGDEGTPTNTILTIIEPIEDYIFEVSASLKDTDYHQMRDVQNALDTMYSSIGSLKSMAEAYYSKIDKKEPVQEESTLEITEDEQVLEQKEDEAKDEINTVIESDLPNEDKKKTIDDSLNEVAYTAVYNVIKKLKSHGYTDLSTNEDAKEQCYQAVLDSFLEIVNESALRNYLNRETLETDAKYVSDYYFQQLSDTVVEWG